MKTILPSPLAFSVKIRMVVFNLIVTVAVIRNGTLLKVIFMWQCSYDDTKADLCLKDGKAEAKLAFMVWTSPPPPNFILLSQQEN